MANLIQHAKDQVSQLTAQAYAAAAAAGVLPPGVEVKGSVEIPKDPQNGDYASSFAMAGAKAMKMAPRAIAQAVVDHMDLTDSLFASVEIAGPGFLNFRLGAKWYGDVLAEIEAEGPLYGQSDEGRGQKVMVEFVSANPTGPMHMGNARGGVLGDTLANILRRDGCDTWKEFYVNDAGNQIHKFAVSIQARYLQLLLGEEKVLSQGTPGLEERTDRVTYTMGQEQSRENMSRNRLAQATPTQVAVGTAQGVEGAKGRFLWPLRGRITSPFGGRQIFGGENFHRGLDIAAPSGTPIAASAGGQVIWAGPKGTYGNLVKIDHGNGFTTYYAHCSELLVQEGDQVTQGQTIALVGSTGRSTGPHCHFELLWQDELLDPQLCLP